MMHESISVIKLIDELSICLSNLTLDSNINDYSQLRKDFIKSIRNNIWTLLLLLEQNNKRYHMNYVLFWTFTLIFCEPI
jgi:hypothetical protein